MRCSVEPSSTAQWSHSKAIMRDPKMAHVRHVRIRSYRTAFWRFHTKGVPSDGLCTVEAVYFLCKEVSRGKRHEAATVAPQRRLWPRRDITILREPLALHRTSCAQLHTGAGLHEDCHCFDDILWYFAFMHKKIFDESRGRLFEPRPPDWMSSFKKRPLTEEGDLKQEGASSGGGGGSWAAPSPPLATGDEGRSDPLAAST